MVHFAIQRQEADVIKQILSKADPATVQTLLLTQSRVSQQERHDVCAHVFPCAMGLGARSVAHHFGVMRRHRRLVVCRGGGDCV